MKRAQYPADLDAPLTITPSGGLHCARIDSRGTRTVRITLCRGREYDAAEVRDLDVDAHRIACRVCRDWLVRHRMMRRQFRLGFYN